MTDGSVTDQQRGVEWMSSRLSWSVLLYAIPGIVIASVIAYAYYNDPLRPLAHTLGLWVALAFAVSWRRPPKLAIAQAIIALGAAVVSYYIGLKIFHDIRWAARGSAFPLNWSRIQLWTVFAVVAGVVFGMLGSRAGKQDWTGAAAGAAFVGLLLGDGIRRAMVWGIVDSRGWWDAAVLVDGLLIIVVFIIATRINRRPWLTIAFLPLVAVAGLAAVWVPDMVEQLLV